MAISDARHASIAYYFDGWAGPLNSYHLKQIVNGPYQNLQPLSGWRDDNPCAVEQQLAWAHSFGVDFFVFDWYFTATIASPTEDLNSAHKITHGLSDRHGSMYDYGSGLQNLGTIAGLQPFSTLSDTGEWTWNQGALKSPLAFIPVAMDGCDPRPSPPPSASIFWVSPSPQDATSLIGDAITWAESNPPVRPEPSPALPIVLIQAWNELLQGSVLVPTVRDGTRLGDSLAAMLSSGYIHADQWGLRGISALGPGARQRRAGDGRIPSQLRLPFHLARILVCRAWG